MNWYKKAQINNISIEDITNAIDTIICREPDLISEEDIANAFERYDSYEEISNDDIVEESYALPKAAQTIAPFPQRTKPKRKVQPQPPSKARSFNQSFKSKVLQLFETGYGLQEMARELGISSTEINQILKSYFPNTEAKKEYLQTIYVKKALKRVEQWKKDLINAKISAKVIAEELGTKPELIRYILKNNNIDLSQLVMERKFLIEDKVAELASKTSGPLTTEKLAIIFKKEFGHPINKKTIAVILNYRNIRISGRKKQNSLFVGLKNFLGDFGQTIQRAVDMDPTKLNSIIDEYVRRYGSFYNFESEQDKRILKNNLMNKLQLRDRVLQQSELGNAMKDYIPTSAHQSKIIQLMEGGSTPQEISKITGFKPQDIEKFFQLYQVKYAPNKLDEGHPSFFLGQNQ